MNMPEILAPAGDTDCFLAALAAGADGIYLGLKNFSARMAAKNFGIAELCRLIELAHTRNCRVYVAMNNLIKPDEIHKAFRLTCRLAAQGRPDGLIVQDLGMIDIARQAGFEGGIAFSTLANVTSPKGLETARKLGADRVITPRELSIDELRMLGERCPPGLKLECFVHGALCYCVSGRCYWSSYLGGRSGLRGRCAQPCRRKYGRPDKMGKKTQKDGSRLFACQDLELAPVARALLTVPNLVSWKIEGRKKGPHYVFHAVTAYKILRDYPEDASQRKLALEILDMALDRPGVRARFLPQKLNQPMAPSGQTASGLLVGKVRIQQDGSAAIKPYFDLVARDLLRVGAEDENWHATVSIKRPVPKAGTLTLNAPRHKTPASGTPVYLIDRKDPQLLKILEEWRKRLQKIPPAHVEEVTATLAMPAPLAVAPPPDMLVIDHPRPGKPQFPGSLSRQALTGVWLSAQHMSFSRTLIEKYCFWLPPAIWPEQEQRYEAAISRLLRNGAKYFVCNSPWQRALFPAEPGCNLIAGPFCNVANCEAVAELAHLGFKGAFASPELNREELLALPKMCPLPLGFVLQGYWPVGVSRFGLIGLNAGEAFQGQGGEIFWSLDRRDLTWIMPAWPLDFSGKKAELLSAGYKFFACLEEHPPRDMPMRKREGLFNWDGHLL